MSETVTVEVDGHELQFELSPNERGTLTAAAGEGVVLKASKAFEHMLGVFGALARKFAAAFENQQVSSAEISMGLKITAKGDFIVVGSSGEASLNLKLTINCKGN
jgi:Trypsin-co-occurring domain 1